MKKRILSFALLLLLLFSFCGCDLLSDTPLTDSQTETYKKEYKTDRTEAPTQPDSEDNLPENSSFAVHFIDVGQADAALILCDGDAMLIDGGNAEDSNLIYTYLQKLGIDHLDYVVCTHAHEDHVGGLSGALTYATVGTAFSPVTEYSTKAFQNFVSKVEAQGKSLTVPTAGDRFSIGSAEVTVVGPLQEYEEPNDTSIVLRIVYGELSFLFTGDMESSAEADLLDAGVELQSTVLKVGHHGSNTSSSYRFLREVAPTYGVISVGTDNSYGHPHEEILSRYRDADVKLYRTDLQGDIICTSNDGKTLTFTTKKNSDAVTNPTESDRTESDTNAVAEYAYIGNLNSKKYHALDCRSLPDEENRIYFTTREEAESKGYDACGICKP
ncbi:MAG: MBL fold metallo-hydrolase [Clostridia bacterium]|nr:MBL fold metallo-hydrolase [Clostridia bacterium]